MDTIKIRYIGARDQLVDPIARLTWSPGLVQEVPVERAKYLLWYRDRYADARPPATRKKEPIFPEQPPMAAISHDQLEGGIPPINLAYAEDGAIRDYAAAYFNVTIPQDVKRDDLVDRVRHLMRTRG